MAFAQQKDSAAIRAFIPTGIRVGLDVVPYARAELSTTFTGFEATVDVDVLRYYPTFEFGNSARDYVAENGSTYANKGNFWRAGIDVNFLKKDLQKNMFFIGGRYARSAYSEDATLVTTDAIWGDYSDSFTNNNMVAQWLELTTGMRIKVWKIFWLGYTARFKFAVGLDESKPLLTTDVPGYGTTDKPTTWGFSYYVLVRLPVRKAK
jgi:hypothetical protein